MEKLGTCLWFADNTEEAVHFYRSLFPASTLGTVSRYDEASAQAAGRKVGDVLTIEFNMGGLNVLALNGGPIFKFSPSLSYFVWCHSQAEIDRLWTALSQAGEVRMPLQQYPWSERYGWTTDRFGLEWQLSLAPSAYRIAPAILFVNELYGKGSEAVQHYTSIFPNSGVSSMSRDEASGTILHTLFTLNGQAIVLMEGAGQHEYGVTPAFSFVVPCHSQEEIDHYWTALARDGAEGQCGWITDKFGISWQIVPAELSQWMKDPATAARVMSGVLKMTKLDLSVLKKLTEPP